MKKLLKILAVAAALGCATLSFSTIGCGDNNSATGGAGGTGGHSGVGGSGGSGGTGGTGGTGGSGMPDADCFMNPTTHVEIINACTDSTKINKNPNLPLRLPDGGLPPLP
jgi:hypothetical protein